MNKNREVDFGIFMEASPGYMAGLARDIEAMASTPCYAPTRRTSRPTRRAILRGR